MKIQEGPLVSALLIGGGIGYLVGRQTGNLVYGVLTAIGLGLADYFFLVWTNSLRNKK